LAVYRDLFAGRNAVLWNTAAVLSDLIGKPISMRTESIYSREQCDIVLLRAGAALAFGGWPAVRKH
jgi:hypothetical protein